jgi:hypothetical protein
VLSSSEVSAEVAVIFSKRSGGIYCVFLLFLGIRTSSSDHSSPTSGNGYPCCCIIGEESAVEGDEARSSMPSAEGQVRRSDLRVESRTSIEAVRPARAADRVSNYTPGDRVAISAHSEHVVLIHDVASGEASRYSQCWYPRYYPQYLISDQRQTALRH